jgi:hypothetical protein
VLLSGVLFIVRLLVTVYLSPQPSAAGRRPSAGAVSRRQQDLREIAALIGKGDWETILKTLAHLLIFRHRLFRAHLFLLSSAAVFAVAFRAFKHAGSTTSPIATNFDVLRLRRKSHRQPMFKLLLATWSFRC